MTDPIDPVARLNAALEGRYAIERELGEGGMATVYLADDLKHERKVALKVLKPELAAVVGAERFLAEIKTTANLTHPHILPLFDSGEADSFLFYVMPHIEGESLRERIDREKQLGVDDAVAITQKVANALDYAHQHGVVHRDIKPGNILLSEQGEPLVADFGIALAVAQAGGGRITETGLSLGTPHYMSPEQATGDRDVDPRSDVYALGCVLFELLAGQPPFSATTAQAVLVKILTADAPSITSERKTVPPHVAHALAQALEKLPADRFTSAAEFATALADESFTYKARARATLGTPTPEALAPSPQATDIDRRAFSAVTVVAVAALGLAAWGWFREAPVPTMVPVRSSLTGLDFSRGVDKRFAISRDGSLIVSRSQTRGPGLFIRRTDQLEYREIPGTEDAREPTFSPDGEWLAFVQEGEIRRVEVSGGPILPVAQGRHPHWGSEGMIVFSAPGDRGLSSVAPSGGEPTTLLVGTDSTFSSRPFLLPGGEAVVFTSWIDLSMPPRLALLEVGSGSVTDLGVAGTNPQYVPTGHLLFGHEDQALMAVPFDLRRLQVTGEPFTVLPDVWVRPNGATNFEVSETGNALYVLSGGAGGGGALLVEVDLAGVETPTRLAPGNFLHPRYSPDGRYIAYERDAQIWVYDRETGSNDQFRELGFYPLWSVDGRYIYYVTPGAGSFDGFRMLADRSGEAELIYRREGFVYPISAAPSGNEFVMSEWSGADRGMNLLIMSEDADTVVFTDYLRADWGEMIGMISPNGRWLAYASDESGRYEVYVRSFPEPTDQVRVSSGDGGWTPFWTPDGTALLYADQDGTLIRASVSSGGEFAVTSREVLFETRGQYLLSSATFSGRNGDLHPDGQTWVAVRDPSQEGPVTRGLSVRLVTDWFEELRGRAGN